MGDSFEFAVRLSDADSFLIDFITPRLQVNQRVAGDDFIVPDRFRKDVKYIDIVVFEDDSVLMPQYNCNFESDVMFVVIMNPAKGFNDDYYFLCSTGYNVKRND